MGGQIAVQGWLFNVAPTQATVPHGGHELTHVVQQGSGMRAWHVRKSRSRVTVRGWDVATKKQIGGQVLPDVGDEILVSFEHGEACNVTVYFNPTEIAIRKGTPWKVEVGSVRRSALRVAVRQRGAGPLRIAVRASIAAAGSPIDRWTTIL